MKLGYCTPTGRLKGKQGFHGQFIRQIGKRGSISFNITTNLEESKKNGMVVN